MGGPVKLSFTQQELSDAKRATQIEVGLSEISSTTPAPIVVGGLMNDVRVAEAIKKVFENQARAITPNVAQNVIETPDVESKRRPGQ